jgi:hypothetical protein
VKDMTKRKMKENKQENEEKSKKKDVENTEKDVYIFSYIHMV